MEFTLTCAILMTHYTKGLQEPYILCAWLRRVDTRVLLVAAQLLHRVWSKVSAECNVLQRYAGIDAERVSAGTIATIPTTSTISTEASTYTKASNATPVTTSLATALTAALAATLAAAFTFAAVMLRIG